MNRFVPSLLAASALALLAGCSGQHDDDDGYYDRGNRLDDDTFIATIDSDFVLDTDLGYEAGVWVEYSRGGRWTIETTCDTEELGYECLWDIYIASTRGEIRDVELLEAESEDFVEVYGARDLALFTTTSFGLDAVTFTNEPGDFVSVETYLDGLPGPEFIVWTADGAPRFGAPRQPVSFQPDAP